MKTKKKIQRKKWSTKYNENHPLKLAHDHPKPITRRDFVAQGFLGSTAIAFLPSVASMVMTAKAYGGNCGPSVAGLNTDCWWNFDFSGGASIGSYWLHTDKNGIPFADSAYEGVGIKHNNANAAMLPSSKTYYMFSDNPSDDRRKNALACAPQSAMYHMFRAMVDDSLQIARNVDGTLVNPADQARIDAYLNKASALQFAMQTNDDTVQDKSPVGHLAKSTLFSGDVMLLAGQSTSSGGGKATVPPQAMMASALPIVVRSNADLGNLMSLGTFIGDLTRRASGKPAQAITNAARTITQNFLELKGQTVRDPSGQFGQLAEIPNCAYSINDELVKSPGAAHSIASDPALLRVCGLVNNNGNIQKDPNFNTRFPLAAAIGQGRFDVGNLISAAVLAYLLKHGVAAGATTEIGGCDYHNGANQPYLSTMAFAGYLLGVAMHVAETRSVACVFGSDGSTFSDPAGGSTNIAVGLKDAAGALLQFPIVGRTGDRGSNGGDVLVVLEKNPSHGGAGRFAEAVYGAFRPDNAAIDGSSSQAAENPRVPAALAEILAITAIEALNAGNTALAESGLDRMAGGDQRLFLNSAGARARARGLVRKG